MGVSGSGKSTIGSALSERLGWLFVDGDSLHPLANVAKMQAGQALDDGDRAPWLAAIGGQIDAWLAAATPGIVTCSALKRRYRDAIIGTRDGVRLVYLEGSAPLIAGRLGERRGHFMPASLLQSQFTTLEPPMAEEHPILVRIDNTVDAIVDEIVTALSLQQTSIEAPA
ncbi:MAG TPA: gluconokinase [Stellaceae bacterium]|nr:gluconokinase [Stellaceae bacterium]